MSQEMQGKICLVTGATLGIGKETALGLARKGAHVVLVGRDAARTRETAAGIANESGNPQVDFLIADLSSQAEVRRLAAEFKDKYPRLDVLLNNAGAIFTRRETTVEGFERTWALNHLAEFLLTRLLLDTLEASAPARIVNVASTAHTRGTTGPRQDAGRARQALHDHAGERR
jgi:retinol dehydrogenase 12